jgi:SAM-dependent methyltransferase
MAKSRRLTVRVMERGLLSYYRESADRLFWDQHWRPHFSAELYRAAKQGDLGSIDKACTTWLPRDGKILEAGCGLGHVVMALRARGWDAEGVEWGPQTVEMVRSRFPGLPIRVGDVTQLDVPDGYYSGYVSLGVIEHRREGPEPFLREAHRVLRPGGIALVSVPYVHPIRALKARFARYRGSAARLEFYQYAFPRQRIIQLMRDAGFTLLDTLAYDGWKGLKDELPSWAPILASLMRWRRLGPMLQSYMRNAWFGHMLLVVGQKPRNGRC